MVPETRILERFIHVHTVLASPPLTPEIRLHLATGVMTLWQDSEALNGMDGSATGILPPPYWGFAWPGGQALARYVLDHPETVKGKNVLDVGSGSGLVAIAAAMAGAASVAAAEIDPLALSAITLNAAANNAEIERIAKDIIGTENRWDVILVGDLCYERDLSYRLFSWLHGIAATGSSVLIGDPMRDYFSNTDTRLLASYEVQTSRDLESGVTREGSVYVLVPAVGVTHPPCKSAAPGISGDRNDR